MSIVTFNNVEKSFGGQRLFTTVTFSVDAHDHAVLVGRNGTGKTTLLRLVSGAEHADSGTIARARGRRIWLHEQTPELERERPVGDYLLEAFGEAVELEAALRATEESLSGLAEHSPELRDTMRTYQQLQRRFEAAGGYGYRSRLTGVVEGLGLPDDMLERGLLSLSGGELTRVTLARALLADADLLLLDEPTNHLDIDSVEWLEGFLADYPRAFVLVTHDRRLLEKVGRRVFAVEHEHVEVQGGDFATYLRESGARLDLMRREYEQDLEKIAQLQRFYDRFHAKKDKAKQAKAKLTQIERIKRGLREPPRQTKSFKLGLPQPKPSARVVLEMKTPALTVGSADDPGGTRTLVRDVDIVLERGEKVALLGANGSGKTTLVETVAGLRSLADGAAHLGHNVRVAYYSQQGRELEETATCLRDRPAAGRARRGAGAQAAGPLPVRPGRGREARRDALRRRAQPPPPPHAARRRRQLPAARRAHQPPRHGLRGSARRRPRGLHRHDPPRDPRPPPHRPRRHARPRDPRRRAAQPPLRRAVLGGARGAAGRRGAAPREAAGRRRPRERGATRRARGKSGRRRRRRPRRRRAGRRGQRRARARRPPRRRAAGARACAPSRRPSCAPRSGSARSTRSWPSRTRTPTATCSTACSTNAGSSRASSSASTRSGSGWSTRPAERDVERPAGPRGPPATAC